MGSLPIQINWLIVRLIDVWNSLPTSIDFSTLSAFRDYLTCKFKWIFTAYKSFDVYDKVVDFIRSF